MATVGRLEPKVTDVCLLSCQSSQACPEYWLDADFVTHRKTRITIINLPPLHRHLQFNRRWSIPKNS